MGEAVYRSELPEQLGEFWGVLSSQALEFGETWAMAWRKSQLADKLGKSLRTIQRYMKTLEELEYINTVTKPGKGGGTVIVFNKSKLDFEPKLNPITTETKSDREILEKVYPNRPKKKPKRRYRDKKTIAEERLRDKMRRSRTSELNDMLEEMEYPTKEFWYETDYPELNYKAYLITRMYNFYAVYYHEKYMNNAEEVGNRMSYELGKVRQRPYKDYDVLPKRFMGTSNFTVAKRLAATLDDINVNPAEYLTVQFNFMQYLLDSGKNTGLPYFNGLISQHSIDRWNSTADYTSGFKKEHPYYNTSPELVVKIEGYSQPLMTALVGEYNNPFMQSSYKQELDMAIDPLITPLRMKVIYGYHTTIKREIAEDNTLTEEEKSTLTQWVEQQTATHISSRNANHAYLMMNLDPMMRQIAEFKGDNLRELFYKLGSYTLDEATDAIERKTRVKMGYFQYFSITGNTAFYNTIRTLRSSRGVDIDTDILSSAINKFGERKIPITEYGNLDVHAVALTHMTEEELHEESLENKLVIPNEQNAIDFFEGKWYDVKEDFVGQSKRDGRMI